MANFYEWLENVQPPYAPMSPPYIGPSNANIPTSQIAPLDISDESNIYFNTMHEAIEEPLLIDPRLADTSAPTASDQAFVAVPEHLVETSSKILIYLARALSAPEDATDEKSAEMTFTT